MIIGISGKIGSGKDTVGNIIQALMDGQKVKDIVYKLEKEGSCYVNPNTSEWEIKKYAAKLKQIVSILTGATMKELESQDFKSKPLGEEWQQPWRHRLDRLMTPRLMLQLIGTEGGRDLIHPNVWVNALMADYVGIKRHMTEEELGGKIPVVPVYKVEYPKWIITDMRFPNEMDAVKERKGFTIRVFRGDGKTGTHASETALDHARFDHVIDNNLSYNMLVLQVEEILKKEGLIDVD